MQQISETNPVTEAQVNAVLSIVNALGEDMSWWLRKHRDAIVSKLEQGKPVYHVDLTEMLRQYESDMRILDPA